MDPSHSGVLSAEDFVAVLAKMFMIEMSETDWASFAQKHAGSIVLRDGTVNYKQFLDTVLDPKMDQGLYTPKAVGRVGGLVGGSARAREARQMGAISVVNTLGSDIPQAAPPGTARSARSHVRTPRMLA